MGFLGSLQIAFRKGGLLAGFSHVSSLALGDSVYFRPSSLVDFRRAGCIIAPDELSFLAALFPEKSSLVIENAIDAAKLELLTAAETGQENFLHPSNWNSGLKLQLVLKASIFMLKPQTVVETGTANGASAASIVQTLENVSRGHLWTVDVLSNVGSLIPENLRARVTFVKTDGSKNDTRKKLSDTRASNDHSIFLHDSDHSYFGQYSDYETARVLGFPVVFSDDVDASFAFLHFDFDRKVCMVDGSKLIGAGRLRENE
jgi:hypothetical protein